MNSAINFRDEYTVSRDRTVLTDRQLHIPGLRMFGHQAVPRAVRTLSWHYHEGAFEFVIPTKGTFSFSTDSGDFPFSAGEVFLSLPGEVHGTKELPLPLGEFYWFQLEADAPDDLLYLQSDAAYRLIEELKRIPFHIVKADISKTAPLIKTAFELAGTGADRQFAASCLVLFLHLIISCSRKAPAPLSPDIRAVQRYILENITADLSLEDLAGLVNLSCSQLKQKFRNQLGISPRNYINSRKIEYAKELLLTERSVTEVSMMLGFSSSSYFSAVFKKYTLYSPREYIRSARQAENL